MTLIGSIPGGLPVGLPGGGLEEQAWEGLWSAGPFAREFEQEHPAWQPGSGRCLEALAPFARAFTSSKRASPNAPHGAKTGTKVGVSLEGIPGRAPAQ